MKITSIFLGVLLITFIIIQLFAIRSQWNIETYKQKLIAALDKQSLSYTNRFYFLGYNAPYEVFNRKNEVIVELKK